MSNQTKIQMNSVQKQFTWMAGTTFFMSIMVALFALFMFSTPAAAQNHEAANAAVHSQDGAASASKGFGLVGAGIAFGLAALGAGIAVASVGAAALGVLSEKPQMLGQAFMFVALGEGIVIFGFVMAFMIMNG